MRALPAVADYICNCHCYHRFVLATSELFLGVGKILNLVLCLLFHLDFFFFLEVCQFTNFIDCFNSRHISSGVEN